MCGALALLLTINERTPQASRIRVIAIAVIVVALVRVGGEWWSPGDNRARGEPLSSETRLAIMSWNLEVGSKTPRDVVDGILDVRQPRRPQVVALQELTPDVADALEASDEIDERYPYRILRPRDGVLGMGLLSSIPLVEGDSGVYPMFLGARILMPDGSRLDILNAHPLPPKIATIAGVPSGLDTRQRDLDLAVPARTPSTALPIPERVLLVGDLNTTPFEPGFGIVADGLHDVHAEVASGTGFTWRPAFLEQLDARAAADRPRPRRGRAPAGRDRGGLLAARRPLPRDGGRGRAGRRLARESGGDPLRVRVDVEPVAAQEPDERHAQAVRGLDREVRRRAHRGEDRDAGDRRLLHELEARPAAHEDDPVVERQRARRAAGSRRACRARCAARRPRAARRAMPSGVNRPAAWRPPVCSNTAWAARSVSGRASSVAGLDRRAGRDRVAADLDLVEARLAADPARRRGDEVALRDGARVERVREPDGDLVVGSAVRRRVGEGEAVDRRRVVDEALGAQEARGQLALVTRRAHRDRDVDRRLVRAGGTDRQRLLAAQPVVALLDRPGAVRRDAGPGRLALDRGRLGVGGSAAACPSRRSYAAWARGIGGRWSASRCEGRARSGRDGPCAAGGRSRSDAPADAGTPPGGARRRCDRTTAGEARTPAPAARYSAT